MSIAIDSFCMQCYLQRNLDLVRQLGSEEKATQFAKELMKIVLTVPEGCSSPWMGPWVSDLLQQMYGLPEDRFREEKLQSNAFVMERMDNIRKAVTTAEDPIFAGLQMAILGNYMDFAALQGDVSFERLDDMIRSALQMELDRQVYASFCRDLEKGKKLLYITDNAGEIGFDRVFGEVLAEKYPHLSITFCVRGAIAANDATREDAAAVGIPFPIIDNGNRIAGTQLDMLGEEAKKAMDEADVILAKGMGNTETMLGCDYNVYYAFLVKCPRFQMLFEKPMMTPIFTKENR